MNIDENDRAIEKIKNLFIDYKTLFRIVSYNCPRHYDIEVKIDVLHLHLINKIVNNKNLKSIYTDKDNGGIIILFRWDY